MTFHFAASHSLWCSNTWCLHTILLNYMLKKTIIRLLHVAFIRYIIYVCSRCNTKLYLSVGLHAVILYHINDPNQQQLKVEILHNKARMDVSH